MMQSPTVELPSGDELPMVGVGTWDISGDTVKESVRAGLSAGYGHVDTAEGYDNEAEVGEVLGDFDRENVFLTSKVLPKHLNYESVIESCENSLEKLGTDYLDLYLIHWPNPAISLRETMSAMATIKDRGWVRNVGVSNFSAYQLSCAQHVSDVPIAVNQIEFHPLFQRPELVDYCQDTDTVVQAAAPLGRTEVFDHPVVQDLTAKYEKSAPQIVLKWELERGIVPLPKSSTPDHVRSNLELFDWEMEDADIERLNHADEGKPVYDTPTRDWTRYSYGISE